MKDKPIAKNFEEDENGSALGEQQVIQYAKELSQLYKAEKDRRKELEQSNLELKKANHELAFLRHKLEQENDDLRKEVRDRFCVDEMIGQSSALLDVMAQVDKISKSSASVLIEGETGTGKELIARAIHEKSDRGHRNFVKVNCASIPKELFESEFFGHIKGAFTGAVQERLGRFQYADSGTLFLDEVSEIPLELQGKLLRVLQEGSFERVGEDKTRKVDVRIIAASNRDFDEEMRQGRFRKDLYYRLGVCLVFTPPLRDRKEDIPILASHFWEKISKTVHCPSRAFTPDHIKQLQNYDWPGNIRELQNVIERALIVSSGENIYFDLKNKGPRRNTEIVQDVISEEHSKAIEKENIAAALEKCNGKVYGPGGAAELLGVQPATLAYRIKKMGLK
ncbi:MAG: sigma 54-interacting transcriptional regulator [Nitrospina sp.]|jgi:transcriptional regulator with GAF, ATPase, and Fis domain|nr:sigma 54-interacting transcriptional regulator [Nitrospina sp.]